LNLPDLAKKAHSALTDEISTIRKDERLNVFRHPGYPDDVQTICGENFDIADLPKAGGEQVWVRIRKQTDHSTFQGELLNQPRFYTLKKGQQINVHLVQKILVCGKPVEQSSDPK